MDQRHFFILVNALNLKVSFVLDTLIVHEGMVGKLQDEVVALRS